MLSMAFTKHTCTSKIVSQSHLSTLSPVIFRRLGAIVAQVTHATKHTSFERIPRPLLSRSLSALNSRQSTRHVPNTFLSQLSSVLRRATPARALPNAVQNMKKKPARELPDPKSMRTPDLGHSPSIYPVASKVHHSKFSAPLVSSYRCISRALCGFVRSIICLVNAVDAVLDPAEALAIDVTTRRTAARWFA